MPSSGWCVGRQRRDRRRRSRSTSSPLAARSSPAIAVDELAAGGEIVAGGRGRPARRWRRARSTPAPSANRRADLRVQLTAAAQRRVPRLVAIAAAQGPVARLVPVAAAQRPVARLVAIAAAQRPVGRLVAVAAAKRPVARLVAVAAAQRPVARLVAVAAHRRRAAVVAADPVAAQAELQAQVKEPRAPVPGPQTQIEVVWFWWVVELVLCCWRAPHRPWRRLERIDHDQIGAARPLHDGGLWGGWLGDSQSGEQQGGVQGALLELRGD